MPDVREPPANVDVMTTLPPTLLGRHHPGRPFGDPSGHGVASAAVEPVNILPAWT